MGRALIYISDGTLSSLKRGEETNAGRLFRLLEEYGQRPDQLFDYDRGIQGQGLSKWLNAASGHGINRSILRGYAFLSTRWSQGDRIYLFGYSRGAYAVRSLAGMIGRIGLVRKGHRGERRLRQAFGLYKNGTARELDAFRDAHCHPAVRVEMVGVWDTVRALGLPYPILSYFAPEATEFHDHTLGPHINHGYHALALDEDRTAFAPILWEKSADWSGRLEQAWFPGAHADIGGETRANPVARGLSNIPFNWIVGKAEKLGLHLPPGWRERFAEDPAAPAIGCRSGIARGFVIRAPRKPGRGDGAMLHHSIADRMRLVEGYDPFGHKSGGAPEEPQRTGRKLRGALAKDCPEPVVLPPHRSPIS